MPRRSVSDLRTIAEGRGQICGKKNRRPNQIGSLIGARRLFSLINAVTGRKTFAARSF